MGEMMEKIARAIFEATAGPYEFASEDGKRVCMLEARAAVEAMRQATVAMSAEGQRVIDAGDATFPSDACWQAMLDALLTEGGRTGEKG